MSFPKFEIVITSQGWISDEPSSELDDLCSHGNLRVVIDGCVVVPGDGDDNYTISTSALALLRTVESDHTAARPGADSLIMHCGQLLMASCPIGIDWQVTHSDGHVRLADVVRYDETDVRTATRFPGLVAELSEAEYRQEVAAFAISAKQPFAGIEKRFHEDFDRQDYEEFWAEYDERLDRALSG
jgi:hypothetical protein